ncbi:MAG: hypothetical protein IPG04_07565 [Polyangiaceae bacterium]|nr:hypothetical protein [Polyangiaceae bacterium]
MPGDAKEPALGKDTLVGQKWAQDGFCALCERFALPAVGAVFATACCGVGGPTGKAQDVIGRTSAEAEAASFRLLQRRGGPTIDDAEKSFAILEDIPCVLAISGKQHRDPSSLSGGVDDVDQLRVRGEERDVSFVREH